MHLIAVAGVVKRSTVAFAGFRHLWWHFLFLGGLLVAFTVLGLQVRAFIVIFVGIMNSYFQCPS